VILDIIFMGCLGKVGSGIEWGLSSHLNIATQ